LRGAHETELLEHVKRVTGLEGRPGEVAAAVEGVSEMEGGDGFVGDAAPLKIGEAHVAPLVRSCSIRRIAHSLATSMDSRSDCRRRSSSVSSRSSTFMP
jgi:hypothetical protein